MCTSDQSVAWIVEYWTFHRNKGNHVLLLTKKFHSAIHVICELLYTDFVDMRCSPRLAVNYTCQAKRELSAQDTPTTSLVRKKEARAFKLSYAASPLAHSCELSHSLPSISSYQCRCG